jgi:RNA polymerase sigma-B factor
MVRVPRQIHDLALRVDRETERLTATLGRSPTAEELATACRATPEHVVEARATATAHYALSLDQLADEHDGEGPARPVAQEEPGYGQVERAADLERLLAHLKPRERTVLQLRFGEDLVQREIARRLGISQMHVSRVIAGAIRRLQEAAEQMTPEPAPASRPPLVAGRAPRRRAA